MSVHPEPEATLEPEFPKADSAAASADDKKPADDVDKLSIDRFIPKRWYFIAHINPMAPDCSDATDTYFWTDRSKMQFRSELRYKSKGKEHSILNKGYVKKTSLWNSAPNFCCYICKFDFEILDAAKDVSWWTGAMSNKKYFWLMSDTPTIPDALYNEIVDRAVATGVDRSKIEKIPNA
jgi:lipocalin